MLAEQVGANDLTDVPEHAGRQGTAAVQHAPKEDAGHSGPLSVNVVHELANLVMIASGSLEQLRRQPLDEQGQCQLARAEWGVRQVARLTRGVLSQARGGDSKAEAVDLNGVVGGFAAVMGQHVCEGVQLAAELAPGRLLVRLDAGLLELVLLNLVRNAADAMPDGGTVVLRTRAPYLDSLGDQPAAEMSVSDTGMGMPPAVAQHAAEAFFTTKPGGRGTGLGLWMAQHFAAAHSGKLTIETAVGQGTTVRLSLPYAGDADPG